MKESMKKAAKSAQTTAKEQVIDNAAEQAVKTKTAKQQAAQEKRDWLRGISAQFQAKRDLMELQGIFPIPTINEMLREYYRKENGVTELNTFDQWKEKGYTVRKGEKAFLFWGKPRAKQVTQAEPANEDGQTEQAEPVTAAKDDFYPICYLFDIAQCHQLAQA